MAEVLSPSMQPANNIAILHSRPSSSDAFQGSAQFQQAPRLGHQSRGMYNAQNSGHRGTAAPVQPYAFQASPNLRQDGRPASGPNASSPGRLAAHKHGHSQSTSTTTTSSSSDVSTQPSAKDDSVIGSRNGSLINLSSSVPDLSLSTFDETPKPSPGRYHRPAQKRTESPGNQPKTSTPVTNQTAATTPTAASTQTATHGITGDPHGESATSRHESADDIALPRTGSAELAKRYRRRSLNTLDTHLPTGPGAQRPASSHGATSTPTSIRPPSLHSRGPSDDGVSSTQQRRDGKENTTPDFSVRADQKGITVPPRGSSDVNKRINQPSPLSKQAVDADDRASSAGKPKTYAAAAQAGAQSDSPAVQHLAAVSDKDLNKGMKSRLRRAFSFGGAQELRRGAAENSNAATNAQQVKEQHQQKIDDGLDPEQQEIARRQEEAGIGAGIYSGQGGFLGSTDNISISSTASSASMMLRKMGRGAKKGARSIKGLFRPKSVIGVPAADGPIQASSSSPLQPSVAQVSMVTVEAERLKVNVNADPAERHGTTGFPKLERNSVDAAAAAAAGIPVSRGSADGSDSRRSIVGSDKERAEVLAVVKKGILKRSGTASPAGSPVIKPVDGATPHTSDSPASSMPSTPKDNQGRTGSINNSAHDYFSPRNASMARSTPHTPNGTNRSISFSPRIQFHDAWSSTEYDRRGEIATCNRLTPMLAQQIKEELNTFKMEMEVHELSKPHTHFF